MNSPVIMVPGVEDHEEIEERCRRAGLSYAFTENQPVTYWNWAVLAVVCFFLGLVLTVSGVIR